MPGFSRDRMRPVRHGSSILSALLVIALTPGSQRAQTQGQRLSAPLPTTITGDIDAFEFSPDGSRIVYLARQDQHEVSELYSVPAAGGTAVKLNPPLVEGGDVLGTFAISPTGSHVVYIADQQVDGAKKLYSVPIDGSSPAIELSDLPPAGFDPVISPTGDVAFLVDTSPERTLYTVPIDGSSSAVFLGGDVGITSVQFSPDGQTLIFRGEVGEDFGLFSAPGDGSAAPLLLQALEDGNSRPIAISPDGSRVVFLSDHDVPGEYELFSVPVLGGEASVLLQKSPVPAGDVDAFVIYPGSDRVLHITDTENLTRGLFVVPIDGSSESVLLSAPESSPSGAMAVTPDGAHVVFTAPVDGTRQLFVVPSDGSVPPVALTNGTEDVGLFAFSPLGTRAVFATSRNLFSVPIDASSAALQLNPVLPANQRVLAFRMGVANGRVAYVADQDDDELYELFSVRIDGTGSPLQLNDVLPGAGDVLTDFQVSPDGTRIVYRADGEENDLVELFAATGAHPNTRLNGPITAETVSTDVNEFWVTPDGQKALYRVVSEGIYSVPTRIGASATLHPELEDVREMTFTSTGTTVIFRDPTDLHAWEPEGGEAPRLLCEAVPASLGTAWRLTSDDERVVCVSNRESPSELWCVPLAEDEDLYQLSGELVPGGNVQIGNGLFFQLTPDETHVVYTADQLVDSTIELFSVPIDGSSPAIRLNGAFVTGGDVESFAISPASDRVLYLADQTVDGRFELFSVSIGGGSAVRLNLSGTSVSSYRFTPDGSTAVFQQSGPPSGIYVAPVDGSAVPTRLFDSNYSLREVDPRGSIVLASRDGSFYGRVIDGSAPAITIANTSVSVFRFVLGGERIVFTSALTPGIFTVPLDAHAPPTRLDEPASFADVQPGFFVAQAGRTVVYRADSLVSGRMELFSVDPRGGFLPQRLNGPLPVGGNVLDDIEHARNGRVLYLADQDEDTTIELYLVVLPQLHIRPAAEPTETVER